MFGYMKKTEQFRNKDWFEAAADEHGEDGPLVTAPHDPAPISSCVLESYESKGLPLRPDMFTTGEASQGCGHAVRSIYQGVRTTSYDYLDTEESRAGVDIITGRYVDKIVLEKRADELVATEVSMQDAEGRTHRVAARYVPKPKRT